MWKGTVPDILDAQAGKVPLTSVEITQMFALLVSLVLVRVGDVVFRSVGVTIGNPVGRIAIGAVTGKNEIEFDLKWVRKGFKSKRWNRVSGKYRGRQVFACCKYVDDLDVKSMIACKKCCGKVARNT